MSEDLIYVPDFRYHVELGRVAIETWANEVEVTGWEFHSAFRTEEQAVKEADRLARDHLLVRVVKRT